MTTTNALAPTDKVEVVDLDPEHGNPHLRNGALGIVSHVAPDGIPGLAGGVPSATVTFQKSPATAEHPGTQHSLQVPLANLRKTA